MTNNVYYKTIRSDLHDGTIISNKPMNSNDVLCGSHGRGHLFDSYKGNEQFHYIVTERARTADNYQLRYGSIDTSIVNEIRAMNPPGRFLKFSEPDYKNIYMERKAKCKNENENENDNDDDKYFWYDIGDKRARSKTQHKLICIHDKQQEASIHRRDEELNRKRQLQQKEQQHHQQQQQQKNDDYNYGKKRSSSSLPHPTTTTYFRQPNHDIRVTWHGGSDKIRRKGSSGIIASSTQTPIVSSPSPPPSSPLLNHPYLHPNHYHNLQQQHPLLLKYEKNDYPKIQPIITNSNNRVVATTNSDKHLAYPVECVNNNDHNNQSVCNYDMHQQQEAMTYQHDQQHYTAQVPTSTKAISKVRQKLCAEVHQRSKILPFL